MVYVVDALSRNPGIPENGAHIRFCPKKASSQLSVLDFLSILDPLLDPFLNKILYRNINYYLKVITSCHIPVCALLAKWTISCKT